MEKLFHRCAVSIKTKLFFLLCFIFCVQLYSQEIDLAHIVETRQYNLLSNYKLIICDQIESETHKYQIVLSKDGIKKVIEEGFYANNLKYYPVFDGIDFDNYFLFRFYDGSYYYTLVKKESGKKIFTFEIPDGMPIYDKENQLLLYNVVNNKSFLDRDVYIYDLKNEKQYSINSYLEDIFEKDILWLNILHWFNSFKIEKIKFDEIELFFFGCYKPVFDEDGEFVNSKDLQFTIRIKR